MNCIWIIVLLLWIGKQGRTTGECGCTTERRADCGGGCARSGWTERRDGCDGGCSRGDWTEDRDDCDGGCARSDWAERRDGCDGGCARSDWTEERVGCDESCSIDNRVERQEKRTECRVEEHRRRSAFDDWEDNTCPCRREMDYYQAEIKDGEENLER